METSGNVTNAFYNTVLYRESLCSTYIGNGLVFTHGDSEQVHQSALSIALLDTPIPWDDAEVDLIFVYAFNLEDLERNSIKMDDFFSIFIDITNENDRMNELRKQQDPDAFYNTFLADKTSKGDMSIPVWDMSKSVWDMSISIWTCPLLYLLFYNPFNDYIYPFCISLAAHIIGLPDLQRLHIIRLLKYLRQRGDRIVIIVSAVVKSMGIPETEGHIQYTVRLQRPEHPVQHAFHFVLLHMHQGSASPDPVKYTVEIQILKPYIQNFFSKIDLRQLTHFFRSVYRGYIKACFLQVQRVPS